MDRPRAGDPLAVRRAAQIDAEGAVGDVSQECVGAGAFETVGRGKLSVCVWEGGGSANVHMSLPSLTLAKLTDRPE